MSNASDAIAERTPRPRGPAQLEDLRRAARLCWWSLGLLGAITVMMYAAMGGS